MADYTTPITLVVLLLAVFVPMADRRRALRGAQRRFYMRHPLTAQEWYNCYFRGETLLDATQCVEIAQLIAAVLCIHVTQLRPDDSFEPGGILFVKTVFYNAADDFIAEIDDYLRSRGSAPLSCHCTTVRELIEAIARSIYRTYPIIKLDKGGSQE